MKKIRLAVVSLALLLGAVSHPVPTHAAGLDDAQRYAAYRDGFDAVSVEADIPLYGFRAIDSQTFDMEHAGLGILKIIPAIHEEYRRVALFFARKDGEVVIKTDDLMANSWMEGRLVQANIDVICISCVDLDGDERQDVIVISTCQNEFGADPDRTYPVGDVLFQDETGFYRDHRLSDKINRFDMNKSAEYIGAFISDGVSMEFLFVAKDLDELLSNGFQPINYLRVTEHLEKFGVVEVMPGYYSMMGQYYLMIYLLDQSGSILWNFQPMRHNENFYDILALSLNDIDGDGNRDLTVLARYANTDAQGNSYLVTDYDIYYQRAGYFLEDTAFKSSYAYEESDDIDAITNRARHYWGWPQ